MVPLSWDMAPGVDLGCMAVALIVFTVAECLICTLTYFARRRATRYGAVCLPNYHNHGHARLLANCKAKQ